MSISYFDLFSTFLKINTVTFGGGYTIVPVIIEEFSQKRNLITNDEMMDIVAVAQSGPGPMAINSSILIGYKFRGWKGALSALLGSVCPCLIIITMIYYVYSNLIHLKFIRSAMSSMNGAISAVLFITVINMGKKALKNHKIFGGILMISSFIVGYFTNINTFIIIISAGIIGLITFTIMEVRNNAR